VLFQGEVFTTVGATGEAVTRPSEEGPQPMGERKRDLPPDTSAVALRGSNNDYSSRPVSVAQLRAKERKWKGGGLIGSQKSGTCETFGKTAYSTFLLEARVL
jgi:hypothetical protein